jgi:CubicO group peptidase (beta-lactamase class C family)
VTGKAGTAHEIALELERRGTAPSVAAGCAARLSVTRDAQRTERTWLRETGGADHSTRLYDLASVTKPMTAVAFAGSGIDRQTPLGRLLAEARGTPSEDVSLELLLAHRAGLDGHRPLYAPLLEGRPADGTEALREAARARRTDATGAPPPGGFEPVYSDLGYLLAGAALARSTAAADAGQAIGRLVLDPLGIADRAGTVRDLAAHGVKGPFVPTEDVAWRGGVVRGAVHDENAWAITGHGGSGHAGIFATVDAVLEFGQAVLDGIDGLGGPFADRDLAWTILPRHGGTLLAGFDGKSEEGSSAGPRMSPRSFGHLGFTGTSLWIDPDEAIVVVLLTNRVHPTREHMDIRSARPWAHDALWGRAQEFRRLPAEFFTKA